MEIFDSARLERLLRVMCLGGLEDVFCSLGGLIGVLLVVGCYVVVVVVVAAVIGWSFKQCTVFVGVGTFGLK